MIKIKITCNWTSSEEITKRLLTQFKTSEDDVKGIEFVLGNNYDFLIVFGYITEEVIDNKPILLFPQEPSWTGSHQKNFYNIKKIKIFGFEEKFYNPKNIAKETIAHMFYGGRGSWEEGYNFWNYDNLISNKFEKSKQFCSFVSTRGKEDIAHPDGCLYSNRIRLIENINKNTPYIDFYGWGDFENLKPYAKNKGSAIKDYRFCLTIENSYEKYYISEKFYDCILTNTIPIYYGCPNIKDFWPENGYILLDDITDYQYIIDKLNSIYKNRDKIYNNMLPNLLTMKKKYFEDFNLLKKIKKELHNF